jgi:ribonuclease T2
MKRALPVAAALLCLCGMVVVAAGKRHAGTTAGGFDYYMLSLSWAPNYCAGHPNDKSAECRVGERTSFVLHGLWPQANAGSPPVNCGGASPVSSALVREMSNYYPSRGLVQHEWQTHGSCTGLSAAEYFAVVKQAFRAIKIPEGYRSLSHDQTLSVSQVEKAFAAANNAPASAFRVSCHDGELVNVEACLTKDLAFQVCTASARECPASQVAMRAVR